MDIKRIAEKLARRFGTHDPFRIAEELGYTIICTPLVGVQGFYQYLKRCPIIYLDSELDDSTAPFVCAHEMGYSIRHRGNNRIFMDTCTFFVAGRYENGANCFAVNLLYSDDDLQPYLSRSIDRAAAYMGADTNWPNIEWALLYPKYRQTNGPKKPPPVLPAPRAEGGAFQPARFTLVTPSVTSTKGNYRG